MIVCRNCGFQNAQGDEFCGSCGTFLEWSGETPAPAGTTADTAGQPVDGDQPTSAGVASQGPVHTDVSAGASATGTPTTASLSGAGTPTRPTGTELVRCPNCGRANLPSRAFCQFCGQRVGGPSTAAAGGPAATTQPRSRMLMVGALAAGVLVIVAGVLVFSGALSGSRSPVASGTPFAAASASASPSASPSAVAATQTPPATEPPTASPTQATSGPTDSPSPTSTVVLGVTPPDTLPRGLPLGGYACDPVRIVREPAAPRWVLARADWIPMDGFDRLELTLTPVGTSDTDRAPAVRVSPATRDELGLFADPPPQGGRRFLLVELPAVDWEDPMASVGQPELTALREVAIIATPPDQPARVRLGVRGEMCYRLGSRNTGQGAGGQAVIVIDVPHP